MFKRIALALALTLALAMPAAAEVTGVYVGAKFIDSIQSRWADGGSLNQNTVGGGVFAGFDFYPSFNLPLRAELEYAIRTDMKEDYNSGWDSYSASFGVQTLMANFYFDFHNSTAFTPYIGAGLGMGFVRTEVSSYNDYSTVFAWNVGAGCAYSFNENFAADLGYRFVGLGETDAKYDGNSLKTTGNAHEFSLGLRLTF